MNVYDFDGTIYDGDSTVDFFLFSLRKQRIWKKFPVQVKGAFLYLTKKIDKTEFKEFFYTFLQELKDTEYLLEEFWNINLYKIKPWYLSLQKGDDVVISASPEFLLKPICEKIGIKYLIASIVDIKTGIYTGENCRGEEKVKRFVAQFGDEKIDNFYSDNRSDYPMTMLAKKSFYVKGKKINEWKD